MSNLILFNRSLDDEIVIVAEIGVNHGGSLRWIKEILPRIKEAGASAAKFQLFTPDLYASRNNEARRKFLETVYLSRNDFLQILEFADEIRLPVFATPVSHDWISFIAETCGVIKIASGDFSFGPTVQTALCSSAKVIASTGVTTLEEVQSFLHTAQHLRPNVSETVALLHCVSAYPPPLPQANLKAITSLRELSNLTVGFSSHFLEDAPLYAALALGARIFEIHVTDNREREEIRDHKLSRTPEELLSIVENLKSLDDSLSESKKQIQPSELEILPSLKKGIVYSRDLPSGHILEPSDLSYARPLDLSLPNVESVAGKQLNRPVLAFRSVELNDLI